MTPEQIVHLLTARGETLSCAESLTGGLISDMFVSVPGASRVFMAGIVSYDEKRKVSLLGVDPGSISSYTAVSRQVAAEMCRGMRQKAATDYALSATGYAGPDGEDVGLVYIGLSCGKGETVRECRFSGSRKEIRSQAAEAAVLLLSDYLSEYIKENDHGQEN